MLLAPQGLGVHGESDLVVQDHRPPPYPQHEKSNCSQWCQAIWQRHSGSGSGHNSLGVRRSHQCGQRSDCRRNHYLYQAWRLFDVNDRLVKSKNYDATTHPVDKMVGRHSPPWRTYRQHQASGRIRDICAYHIAPTLFDHELIIAFCAAVLRPVNSLNTFDDEVPSIILRKRRFLEKRARLESAQSNREKELEKHREFKRLKAQASRAEYAIKALPFTQMAGAETANLPVVPEWGITVRTIRRLAAIERSEWERYSAICRIHIGTSSNKPATRPQQREQTSWNRHCLKHPELFRPWWSFYNWSTR